MRFSPLSFWGPLCRGQFVAGSRGWPPLRVKMLRKASKSARSLRSAKNAAVRMAVSFSATAVATN